MRAWFEAKSPAACEAEHGLDVGFALGALQPALGPSCGDAGKVESHKELGRRRCNSSIRGPTWLSTASVTDQPKRLGGQIIRPGSSTSALRTFELRRDPLSKQWLLESITDN